MEKAGDCLEWFYLDRVLKNATTLLTSGDFLLVLRRLVVNKGELRLSHSHVNINEQASDSCQVHVPQPQEYRSTMQGSDGLCLGWDVKWCVNWGTFCSVYCSLSVCERLLFMKNKTLKLRQCVNLNPCRADMCLWLERLCVQGPKWTFCNG